MKTGLSAEDKVDGNYTFGVVCIERKSKLKQEAQANRRTNTKREAKEGEKQSSKFLQRFLSRVFPGRQH